MSCFSATISLMREEVIQKAVGYLVFLSKKSCWSCYFIVSRYVSTCLFLLIKYRAKCIQIDL